MAGDNSNNSPSAAPPESEEALAREKMRLEIEELRQAPIRAGHAQRLTLFATLLVASLSAATTGIVSYATYSINSRAQIEGDRAHQAETYAKLLENLGSTNVPARAGAVVGLAGFTNPNDFAQANQTVTILVTQLSSETDSHVLHILIPALVDIGLPALDGLVRVNRSAASRFITDTRLALYARMPPLTDMEAGIAGTDDDSNESRGHRFQYTAEQIYFETFGASVHNAMDLDLLTDGELAQLGALPTPRANYQNNLFALNAPARTGALDIMPFQLVMGPADDLDEIADQLSDVPLARAANTPTLPPANVEALAADIRTLFVTSLAISRIMKANSGRLAGRDFSRLVLLDADLRQTDLSDVNLRDSFLAGDADGAKLVRSDLERGDLRSLNLAHADMSYSSLYGARLPPPTYASAEFESNGPIMPTQFTGADWWNLGDLYLYKPDNSQRAVGVKFLFAPTPAGSLTWSAQMNVYACKQDVAPGPVVPPGQGAPAQNTGRLDLTITFCALLDRAKAGILEKKFPQAVQRKLILAMFAKMPRAH